MKNTCASCLQDFAAPREIVWLNGAPGSGKVGFGLSRRFFHMPALGFRALCHLAGGTCCMLPT